MKKRYKVNFYFISFCYTCIWGITIYCDESIEIEFIHCKHIINKYGGIDTKKDIVKIIKDIKMRGVIMPEELKKYFWDTKFEELDIRKNKRYIISRLYCYGDLKAIKWIKETYSKEDIKEVAVKSRDLKPLVANYLRQQFNLKKEEMAYYSTVQGMNYEYWRVKN